MDFLEAQAFWTAVGALGGILALYFIYRQLATTRHIAAYEFLRREDDRFRSEDMQNHRSNLAKTLLQEPQRYEKIDEYADHILDYLEDLGMLVRKNLVPESFVWTSACYYVLRYWEVLRGYVEWSRATCDDPTYYIDFEHLRNRVMKREESSRGKSSIELPPDELSRFLREELDIKVRRFSPSDLGPVMGIEKSSFAQDAYDDTMFEKLHREHPGGFFVAELGGEVVGYVVGYIEDGRGEFDSLAIDPEFRNLGIATTLVKRLRERFRKQGVKIGSLEVRTENEPALRLFEKLGFRIRETLHNYYLDGGNAYRMETDVAAEPANSLCVGWSP